MMDTLYRDVLEFARKHGHAVGTMPAVPAFEVRRLRMRLISEEYWELIHAMGDGMDDDDLPAIAKEAMDLVYVVVGTLIACGISAPEMCEIWTAVHKSNMTRTASGPGDSKAVKGDGYIPPDIAGILERQGPLDADGGVR